MAKETTDCRFDEAFTIDMLSCRNLAKEWYRKFLVCHNACFLQLYTVRYVFVFREYEIP